MYLVRTVCHSIGWHRREGWVGIWWTCTVCWITITINSWRCRWSAMEVSWHWEAWRTWIASSMRGIIERTVTLWAALITIIFCHTIIIKAIIWGHSLSVGKSSFGKPSLCESSFGEGTGLFSRLWLSGWSMLDKQRGTFDTPSTVVQSFAGYCQWNRE